MLSHYLQKTPECKFFNSLVLAQYIASHWVLRY